MISRRNFLIGTGVVGGGLVLGMLFKKDPPVPGLLPDSFAPNAFLQITSDNQVIFQCDRTEMGQGIFTGLATLVAEELDIDPTRIKVEAAGVHPDFAIGQLGQSTGGSTSINKSWQRIREAGAVVRAMLVTAAAEQWSVAKTEITTSNGVVLHQPSGKQLTYGELALAAAQFEVPENVTLKDAADYQYIGKFDDRLDARIKVNGTAQYGMDVDLPNMKIAVVKRCPHFGGVLKSFDRAAEGMPGVVDVLEISNGVAVVADTYWQAKKALVATEVVWDKGPLAGLSSEQILTNQRTALRDGKMKELHASGDVESQYDRDDLIEAEYILPFLHHSPMEPQNTTVLIKDGKAEVWSPTQGPDMVRTLIHEAVKISKQDIEVHSMLMGGGFGRRAIMDFAVEAAEVASKHEGTPIKLMWSREDDMQHDYYRPSSVHQFKGGLDQNQQLSLWTQTMVSSSVLSSFAGSIASSMLPSAVPRGVTKVVGNGLTGLMAKLAPIMEEGTHIPYSCEHTAVNRTVYDPGIPTGFWRSVGNSFNGFVTEGFMDEMAQHAGRDPVEFRLSHMNDFPRDKAVLELVAEKSNWGKGGLHQGVAVHPSFGSFVAMVAEVSVAGTEYSVDRVYAAVDCGRVINPGIVKAQIEGAVIYALTAATKTPVKIEDGAVAQSNFHDLPVLRMHEAPQVEVFLIDSEVDPTGVGEIGVPPVAPAVANALFAATNQRLRELPLRLA